MPLRRSVKAFPGRVNIMEELRSRSGGTFWWWPRKQKDQSRTMLPALRAIISCWWVAPPVPWLPAVATILHWRQNLASSGSGLAWRPEPPGISRAFSSRLRLTRTGFIDLVLSLASTQMAIVGLHSLRQFVSRTSKYPYSINIFCFVPLENTDRYSGVYVCVHLYITIIYICYTCAIYYT